MRRDRLRPAAIHLRQGHEIAGDAANQVVPQFGAMPHTPDKGITIVRHFVLRHRN